MKCTAYIDPTTGIALEGEALVAALKNPDAPRCRYELEPDDRFCPSCGASVEISSGKIAEASNTPPKKNRATRAVFWGSVVLFFLTNLLYFALAGENYTAMDGSLGRGIFIKILGYVNLFAYGFYIKISIRRLHDIERSGWWIAPSICFTIIATILMIVSVITESTNVAFLVFDWVAVIVNLGMVAWLGFAKGTKGPNKYGPDPLAGDTVFCGLETAAAEKGETSVGISEPQLDNPKHDGGDQSRPSAAADVERPPKPRTKSVAISIVVVVVGGIVSFIFQYLSRQQRARSNDAINAFWQSREFQESPMGKMLNESSERRSAEQGDAEAQLALGIRYYNGIGVEQDRKEAVKWFGKAAKQGNAEAQSCLGDCYLEGEGVEKDAVEAVKWYRKAADQGLAIARRAIGLWYFNGESVKQDKVEAVKWFRKAAEQKLGPLTLSHGVIKLRNPISSAIAKEGVVGAQFLLGACYESGEGVELDMKEAVKWYRKAAEQGHAEAQFNLGVCYNNGEGVEKDSTKAVEWFQKAAANGNEKAEAALALETLKGNVERDKTETTDRTPMAVEEGSESVKKPLKRLGVESE